jgi:N-acetylglucosaminyl-diphospho-decaprenol L-rhamnosyltransferase
MDLSVVTVAYRSASSISPSIDSVLRQQHVTTEILVVDNASPDNTLEVLRQFGQRIRLFENRENVGFGRGCNQGFAAAKGRQVYFLNPDAELTSDTALQTLCRAMEDHPQWGIAGTRVLKADDEIEAPALSYPDQDRVTTNFASLPGKIAWVIGASMMVRRNVFEQLGGFDPAFFMYGEETDLCLRARRAGFEIGYVEDVEVRHIGGASEQGKDPYDVWLRRTAGLHQFWKKHYRPEDVARLVRLNRLRSRYRMVVNGLLAKLSGPGSTAWQKHRRYRAVWEMSRDYGKPRLDGQSH